MNKGSVKETIDSYTDNFPGDVKILLEKLRETIKKVAPTASEAIKYAMPTFVLEGNLVHYAAYKNHIGFYPAPSGIEAFKNELSEYTVSKGAVQFPYHKEIPFALIAKIVAFRVKENLRKHQQKMKTCENGHRYSKSSDCPVCPVCEKENKPVNGFLALLSAPARRALMNNGITSLDQLSQLSVRDVLKFHGLGKSSIPVLQKLLEEKKLNFSDNKAS